MNKKQRRSTQLIWAFVLAYAKSRFSHDAVHIWFNLTSVLLEVIFFSMFIARTCDLNARFLVFSITCWYGDIA